MTPEQLRASILQQAMEGKLVKQDPNDEPASVLLEKIGEEKARLIKEKKIKRTKKLPEITDDEKPFEIPDSWKWVKLDKLFQIKGGKRVPKGMKLSETYQEGSKIYIRVADMKHESIDTSNLKYANSKIVDQIKKYTISSNDLYFSIAGSIGKVGTIPDDLSGSQLTENAAKLVPFINNRNFKKYVLATLKSNCVIKQYTEIISRVAQPKLALIKIRGLIIPLPPLAEQKRIVARLDQLMPLVDKYAEAYDKLKKLDDGFNDKLKQSLLQYAMEGKLVKQDPNDEPASVLLEKIAEEKARLIKEKKIKRTKKLPEITDDEKPFEIPDSWEWVRIGNLVNIYTGLSYNKSKLQEQSNDMVRVLRGGNINGSNYTVDLYDDDVMIDRKYLAKNNLLLKRGQLLTPSVTSDKQLGKIAIVRDDYNDIVAGGFIFNIVPFIDNEVFSKYFMFVFSSRFIKQQLLNAANKSGQAFYNVSKTKFQKLTLPIPPLAEQKRIVAKINQLMATIH